MNTYKMNTKYGADLTMIIAKAAKSIKYSLMCIMFVMARGMSEVHCMLLKLRSNISWAQ